MTTSTDIIRHDVGKAAALAVPIRGLDDLMQIGGILASSGFFKDTRDEAQAVAKILAGMELGIAAVASLRGVYIVEGQITLAYPLLGALIKRSGKYNFKVREKSDKACILDFYENGELAGTESITWAQVEQRGLHLYKNGSVKEVWKKFPENMLFARCLSNGAKTYTSEVFNGPVYTPDELGAEVDGITGAVVEVPALPEFTVCEGEGCGALICDFTNAEGKTMKAATIEEGTRAKYGKALCWNCAQKAKAALEESQRVEKAIKESFPTIHEATPASDAKPLPKEQVAARAKQQGEQLSAKRKAEQALYDAKARYSEALGSVKILNIKPARKSEPGWKLGDFTSATQELRQAIQDAIYSTALETQDIPTNELPKETDELSEWMAFAVAWELVASIKAEGIVLEEEEDDAEGEEWELSEEEIGEEIPN